MTNSLLTRHRYYSNSFTDKIKQDAINLFLGMFKPYQHPFPLWEIGSDFALHNMAIMR